MGGRQYTLSLVKLLDKYRSSTNADFDLSVLGRTADDLQCYSTFRDRLRECSEIESALDDWTLPNRVRWKLKRSAGGAVYPRLEEGLERLGVTFAYPVSIASVPSADWIPDFQFHHFPDGSQQWEINERIKEFTSIAQNARAIVLSSRFVEKDCHKLFPQTVGRTHVFRFRADVDFDGAADPDVTVTKYNLPKRFFLVSNQLIPTKNHNFVLEALARIPKSERSDIRVVFTGDIYDLRNPGYYNTFLSLQHTLGVSGNVSHLGLIPKADQIQLMRAAVCYLQPSKYEGWNTGVEEARLIGKPILLSDIEIHREQEPPAAAYFDLSDPGDLAKKLRDVHAASPESGFNPEAERAAIDQYHALQMQCAKEFLAVAQTIAQSPRGGVR